MHLLHIYNLNLHMREANTFDIFLLTLSRLNLGFIFLISKIATLSYEPFTLALVRVFCKLASLLIFMQN